MPESPTTARPGPLTRSKSLMQRIRGKKDGASSAPPTPAVPDRPGQMMQQNSYLGRPAGGRGGYSGNGGRTPDEYVYVNQSAVSHASREKRLPHLPPSPTKDEAGGYNTDGDRTGGLGRKMTILQKAKDLVAGAR